MSSLYLPGLHLLRQGVDAREPGGAVPIRGAAENERGPAQHRIPVRSRRMRCRHGAYLMMILLFAVVYFCGGLLLLNYNLTYYTYILNSIRQTSTDKRIE